MKKSHYVITIGIQLLLKCLDICFPSQSLFCTFLKKHHFDHSIVKSMLLLYLLKLIVLDVSPCE